MQDYQLRREKGGDRQAEGFEMNNMRLLITGGAGFTGSAVVWLAISRGYEVINLDVHWPMLHR